MVDVSAAVDRVLFESEAKCQMVACNRKGFFECFIERGGVEEEIVNGGFFDIHGYGHIVVCVLEVDNIRWE